MDNNLYQNIDIPSTNPLEPESSQILEKTKKTGILTALKNIKDPKIKMLLILGIILIILLVVSLIVTLFRKTPSIVKEKINPTPIPQITLTPTKTSSIPPEFVSKFNQIEEKLKLDENFEPPQIDSETGL